MHLRRVFDRLVAGVRHAEQDARPALDGAALATAYVIAATTQAAPPGMFDGSDVRSFAPSTPTDNVVKGNAR